MYAPDPLVTRLPRRLSPHRQAGHQRFGRVHDSPARSLAVRRARGSATEICSARASTLVGYECDGCEFTYRDGLPHPTGEDGTPLDFEILGTAPAAHFTRTTSTRPPKPDEPSEIEFIASRLFNSREPAAIERIAAGHAVLGTYTSAGGGTVVTSGSTDWAHGLAGPRPAGRADHPQRARPPLALTVYSTAMSS